MCLWPQAKMSANPQPLCGLTLFLTLFHTKSDTETHTKTSTSVHCTVPHAVATLGRAPHYRGHVCSGRQLAWGCEIVHCEVIANTIKYCISDCEVFILGVATLRDNAAHAGGPCGLKPDEAVLDDNTPAGKHNGLTTCGPRHLLLPIPEPTDSRVGRAQSLDVGIFQIGPKNWEFLARSG